MPTKASEKWTTATQVHPEMSARINPTEEEFTSVRLDYLWIMEIDHVRSSWLPAPQKWRRVETLPPTDYEALGLQYCRGEKTRVAY